MSESSLSEVVERLHVVESLLTDMHWCLCGSWCQLFPSASLPHTSSISSYVSPSVLGPSVPCPEKKVATTSQQRRLRAKKTKQNMWFQLQSCITGADPTTLKPEQTGHDGHAMFAQVEHSQDATTSCIDVDCLAERIDDHVNGLMKKLRGEFTTWPPIRDMTEKEGCDTLHSLCQSDVMSTITETLQQTDVIELSDEQKMQIGDCISKAVDVGLDRWRSFAELVSGRSNQKDETKSFGTSSTCSLRPLTQSGMPQPSEKKNSKPK